MKKTLILLVAAAGLLAATVACATDAPQAPTDPAAQIAQIAAMDGKEIYRNVCKTCHGAEAEAGEYTPMSLIMEQWDEFFQDTFLKTHEALTCPSDKDTKLIEVLTKDALKKVQKFCVDHAADSEQPMTCG
jgi:cytochrome c553